MFDAHPTGFVPMKILVSGLINIETTLRVAGFPLVYNPVNFPFFGVQSSVSGVGFNLAKALTLLGNEVRFLSLIGKEDIASQQVRTALAQIGVDDTYILGALDQTAQSVILYDCSGQRQIHTDLKDIQDQTYPIETFHKALDGCELAVLCNINFSRGLLDAVRQRGITIATDVHTISDLEDSYNADFMRSAAILFMSHENLPDAPETWARKVVQRYENDIVVIGLGAEGLLLAVGRDKVFEHIPAAHVRPVTNSIGAGDALFSAFLHTYLASGDPYLAARKAVVFASYKIGAVSAADGFLDEEALDEIFAQIGKEANPRQSSHAERQG
jgi:sugar/nucleoside kinase (ribokinase family)